MISILVDSHYNQGFVARFSIYPMILDLDNDINELYTTSRLHSLIFSNLGLSRMQFWASYALLLWYQCLSSSSASQRSYDGKLIRCELKLLRVIKIPCEIISLSLVDLSHNNQVQSWKEGRGNFLLRNFCTSSEIQPQLKSFELLLGILGVQERSGFLHFHVLL